ILKGPSGCGKTLILVHKALFLLRYNPAVTSILFVCFNITLVRYIKRMLAGKQVPMGENGVEVVHFYELCDRITGDKVDYEGQDQDYYQIVLDDTIEASKRYRKYDAILIDEGQDFSDDMFKVVMNLLNSATDILTIALDEKQNIYSRTRNWKELGIHARGRTHTIKYIYRSTKELTEFSARFSAGAEVVPASGLPRQNALFPGYFDYHGPKPAIDRYATLDELLNRIADEVNLIVTEKQYPLSEIAILYTKSKVVGHEEGSLPAMIGQVLDNRGILYDWVSEDYRAKKTYDITTDSVTVSTVHSVKGFDYAAVFVVGLDLLDQSRWTEEQINRLTYVAITRARFRLYLPYITENNIIESLIQAKDI
ncbi:MAG: 3'-5' exonuclease, partial [Thermodesulfobacteriota bacterium]|nr:3'-5' exonuclease [Thermodesulfobacteriota bacterium]